MTNDELNQHIKHYIEKDRTGRAIMLSGSWGMGKSYYIKNVLIPFLSDSDNGENRCIVVSLYGLSSLSEISKAIYFETRLRKLIPKSEAITTALISAKTVIKGIASFWSVDLSAKESDLQTLYQSVDLSGRLIILEDVERTNINICDLLGYVNNLVEQDNVKVMLVTNEEEIIQYKTIESKNQEENETNEWLTDIVSSKTENRTREYTEETIRYLKMKEKSIGDTIIFTGDLQSAVKEILTSFDNDTLERFANDHCSKDIVDIMYLLKCENLRSVIFACQKAADIYNYIEKDSFSVDFLKTILYGIIAFSIRLHSSADTNWIGLEYYSQELGIQQFPLFRFCYDYIMTQHIDIEAIPVAAEVLKKFLLYNNSKTSSDPDLQCLTSFHIHTEAEVRCAIENITQRLLNPEDISFYDYGRIAVALVMVKYVLDINIDSAKTLLINNLKGRGNEIKEDDLFWHILSNSSKEEQEEFVQLREDMIHSLEEGKGIIPDFDYLPEQASQLYSFIIKNEGIIYDAKGFAKNIDIKRLAEMFFQCKPAQMDQVRGIFVALYRPRNIKQFFGEDLTAIEELLTALENHYAHSDIDDIQQLQYKWFVENLTEIRNKLL